MPSSTTIQVAAVWAMLGFIPLHAADDFALHQGDVVVFFGDSLTENEQYTNPVETYVVTRYANLQIRFVNAGWTGDTVLGGAGGSIDERLQRDVIPYNPSMVVIMLGMNDVLVNSPVDPKAYAAGYQHIIDTLLTNLPNVRITLLQPSAYDDVTHPPSFAGGYNIYLQELGGIVSGIAASNGLLLGDANAPMLAALQAANSINPSLAQTILPDRIHPGAGGALLIAEALLKTWNASPVVSRVRLDAGGMVVDTTNTSLSNFQSSRTPDGNLTLSWTQFDNALPTAADFTDPVTALVMKSSDFLSALNQQTVQIANLPPGYYQLAIDGQSMGIFTAAQFAKTVDLAGFQTPMNAQAQRVQFYTLQHNQLHQVRWRQVQIPYQPDNVPSYSTTLTSLDKMEADLQTLQQTAAQPVPHQFVITSH